MEKRMVWRHQHHRRYRLCDEQQMRRLRVVAWLLGALQHREKDEPQSGKQSEGSFHGLRVLT